MKITVKGHTRSNGVKVKGYSYTRGTKKKKIVKHRTRHSSAAEAERAEMSRIFKGKRKGPSKTATKRQMAQLRGMINHKRTSGKNRAAHKRRLARLEKHLKSFN